MSCPPADWNRLRHWRRLRRRRPSGGLVAVLRRAAKAAAAALLLLGPATVLVADSADAVYIPPTVTLTTSAPSHQVTATAGGASARSAGSTGVPLTPSPSP